MKECEFVLFRRVIVTIVLAPIKDPLWFSYDIAGWKVYQIASLELAEIDNKIALSLTVLPLKIIIGWIRR